jgi:hypothetical protein
MKKTLVLVAAGLLLLNVSGCGASADSLMKEQIALMNEMADALEKDQPEAKIADIKKRMDANTEKMKNLKVSEADQKKLMEKYQDEMMKAAMRLAAAQMKKGMKDIGGGIPGIPNPPKP